MPDAVCPASAREGAKREGAKRALVFALRCREATEQCGWKAECDEASRELISFDLVETHELITIQSEKDITFC